MNELADVMESALILQPGDPTDMDTGKEDFHEVVDGDQDGHEDSMDSEDDEQVSDYYEILWISFIYLSQSQKFSPQVHRCYDT